MSIPEKFQITKETPLKEVNDRMFPEPKRISLTYQKPNVLISRGDGTVHVRNGGFEQLEHEIEEWFSFEEDERQDRDFPMAIQRQNAVMVCGHSVPVLDETSAPTAADYLSQVGKRTLILFNRVPVPMSQGHLTAIYEKQVYRNRRVWIILP